MTLGRCCIFEHFAEGTDDVENDKLLLEASLYKCIDKPFYIEHGNSGMWRFDSLLWKYDCPETHKRHPNGELVGSVKLSNTVITTLISSLALINLTF